MSGPLGSSQWMYASETGYQIEDSLRFEDGSSAYLSRTPAVAGSLTTWTWSGWVKRGNLINGTLFSANANSNQIIFESDRLYYEHSGVGNYYLITTNKLRDTSAWYHVVFVWDTTNATSTDRMRIYINGDRVTAFDSQSYPVLNNPSIFNSAVTHEIGHRINPSLYYFDGYLSDVYFIDGQALDPTDFGETIDGYWRPIPYAGTYGTNGFHLELNGNTNDSSGNGNDWTANNISAHDYVPDSPTNNFAVLNPLANVGSGSTLSEGNLQAAYGSGRGSSPATMGMPEGKWYWEATITATSTVPPYCMIGISLDSFGSDIGVYPGANSRGYGYYGLTGDKYNVSSSTYGDTFTTGDIIGVAFDNDNGTLTFYKNGVSQGVAYSGLTQNVYFPVIADVNTTQTFTIVTNFGQDSTFAGATTAGGNTDANGVGDFKYAPPAGFLSLCSASLPTPTIIDGSQHFVPYIYTADNTSPKSRTGMGFSPDFLWFKDRTTAFSNGLYDTVRGPNKQLQTNNTSAENSYTLLPSFDADGFTTQTDGTAGNVLNYTTDNYVTWSWKAGGTAVSNTDGSITSQVSANVDAGFSIVSYTGNATSGATVGHGLGVKPSFIIAKKRSATGGWVCWHKGLTGANEEDRYIYLNLTSAQANISDYWGTTGIASDTFGVWSVGGDNNAATSNFIAYCFADVEGFSKAGSYTGNGSSDGPMVFTNFRPSFILTKRSDATSWWGISDSKRSPFNEVANTLAANESYSESVLTSDMNVDFLSNGFKIRDTDAYYNASGGSYIFLAIASTPFKFSPAR
jgi:hypothetical protein